MLAQDMSSLILLGLVFLGWGQCDDETAALGREFREALRKYHVENLQDIPSLGSSESAADALRKDRYDRFQSFKNFKKEVHRVNRDPSIPYIAAVNQFSVEKIGPESFRGLNYTQTAAEMDSLEEDWDLDLAEDEKEGLGSSRAEGLPEHVDWRDRLNPIRHQGECGSCWAYSAVATAEYVYYMATGIKKEFSDQSLVDCARPRYNKCMGLDIYAGFYYILDNLYLPLKADYPVNGNGGRQGACYLQDTTNSFTNVKRRYMKRIPKDDFMIQSAISKGVITVAIKADEPLMAYKEGIYYDKRSCQELPMNFPNHAINAVGYGVDGGRKYWLLRNSWGAYWGEKGYFRMSRDHKNACSINLTGVTFKLYCVNKEECEMQKDTNQLGSGKCEP